MQAEQIEATRAKGFYVYGDTAKQWAAFDGKVLNFTTEGHPVLDDEMYFVNEHGVWLVE